jgi:hypothetical protein
VDVRIIGVHNRYRNSVDKGKPFREDHQNRLVPMVSLFPFVLVLHRPSHVWISGMNTCLGCDVALLLYGRQLGSFRPILRPFCAGDFVLRMFLSGLSCPFSPSKNQYVTCFQRRLKPCPFKARFETASRERKGGITPMELSRLWFIAESYLERAASSSFAFTLAVSLASAIFALPAKTGFSAGAAVSVRSVSSTNGLP